MLIGIDGNEANVKERVGVNVWAYELLKGLRGIRRNRGIRWVIYLNQQPLPDLPKETEFWHYRVIGPGKFWTRWRLPLDLYLHRPQPNVFLSLSHYAPKWAPMPRIICIMDLSFLEFPTAFKPLVLWQLKHWTEESIKKATHIVAISEFTKKEIIKYCCYLADRITVIYPGISEIFKGQTLRMQDLTLQKYKIRGKYILFVGTLQPKKNLPRLIQAFELVRKRFPEVELVIAGKIWGQFVKDEILPSMEGSHPSIKYVGFVDEQDLPVLMTGAKGLIVPSLYEGFGIPVLEAMAVGTPVAVSNVTSLPEVVGSEGKSFDPDNVGEIAGALEWLWNLGGDERKKIVKKGMMRARQFDWQKSAKKVLDILINER